MCKLTPLNELSKKGVETRLKDFSHFQGFVLYKNAC